MDLITLALAKKYTDEKIETGGGSNASIQIDTTLSQSGAAADAKTVGDALANKQSKGDYVKTVNGATPDANGNVEIPVSGGNVDLTGYATEQYVKDYAQPKGNYLTEVPSGYATEEFVKSKIAEAELGGEEVDLSGYAQKSELPTKVSELENDAGYLTEHQDLSDYAKKTELPVVPVQSVNGKTGTVKLSASDVGARPNTWMPTAQDVGALPNTYTPPNQTAEQVGADPKGTATSAVSQHNTADDSHGDIRLELKVINDRLTAFFDSDNQTLDELSEIVAYITSNKSLIDSITTSKVSVADIVNNLTSNVTNKPLSAAQGVALKALIDAITIPTKLSQLTNDKGYITGYTETDPTVPAWAKQPEKPKYTAQEVGALPADTFIPALPDPSETGQRAWVKHKEIITTEETWGVTVDMSDGGVLPSFNEIKMHITFPDTSGETPLIIQFNSNSGSIFKATYTNAIAASKQTRFYGHASNDGSFVSGYIQNDWDFIPLKAKMYAPFDAGSVKSIAVSPTSIKLAVGVLIEIWGR